MNTCPNCPNQLPENPEAGVIECKECGNLVLPPLKPEKQED